MEASIATETAIPVSPRLGTTTHELPLSAVHASSDATRHICAGIYEDRLFGQRVYQRLLRDRHHAIGPAPGVDLTAIARHAIAARRRAFREDVLVVLALVAMFVLSAMLVANRHPPTLALLPLFAVSLYRTWDSRFGALARRLKRGHFVADPVHGHCSDLEEQQLARIEATQNGNTIVYSNFSPFVGAGIELHGWSFTVDLTKGRQDASGTVLEPKPIDVLDLYAQVDRAVHAMGIAGLETADYVFVNGRDIRSDSRFLRDALQPPSTSITPAELRALMDAPTTTARHYKCVRITDWGGELVLSTFFRFARSGSSLFVECSFWLLTPVKEAYRDIDNRSDRPTLRQAAQLVTKAAVLAPFLAVLSPILLVRRLAEPWIRWRSERAEKKQIREQLLYDYGASESVRELAASGQYRRYFQKLDKEMFFKLTQRAIIDALAEQLEDANVDTSDVRERRTTIFNSGVIVSGGTVQADTLTVGHGARSLRERFAPAKAPQAPAAGAH